MAGNIFAKERAIVTLTSTGASLTTGTAGAANGTADLDARTGGNAPDDLRAQFELTCQWVTVTGLVANTVIGELYLVPALDGTNFPDLDTSGGVLPMSTYVGSFVATKAPTSNTNMRFISPVVDLMPVLYRPYLKNPTGTQTISANWTLKVVSAQAQYT